MFNCQDSLFLLLILFVYIQSSVKCRFVGYFVPTYMYITYITMHRRIMMQSVLLRVYDLYISDKFSSWFRRFMIFEMYIAFCNVWNQQKYCFLNSSLLEMLDGAIGRSNFRRNLQRMKLQYSNWCVQFIHDLNIFIIAITNMYT